MDARYPDSRGHRSHEYQTITQVLGGGAFAFVAVVAYWILALTLANHMKSDLVPQDKGAATKSAM